MSSTPANAVPRSIWRTELTVDQINQQCRDTLAQRIGIQLTEIGPDYLRAIMPVNMHTHQPMGVLHGGASVSLAETLGSIGGNLCVDQVHYFCMGQEVNANHVRSVATGVVTGTARPCHIGGSSQVWQIDIHDELNRLVCISRLTLAVMERRRETPGLLRDAVPSESVT